MLTTGVDRGAAFTGGSGDDTFNAYPTDAAPEVETLTALDVIDGGEGTDTLNVAALGTWTAPTSAIVRNIEVANIVGDAVITVDASNWSGLETLNVAFEAASSSTGATLTAATTTDVTVANAGAAVSVTGGATVAVAESIGGVTVADAAGAVSVADAAGGITVTDAGGAVSVTESTGAITVTDAAGAVTVADADNTVTIDGGTDVTVSGVAGMDATIGATTAATGNITLTHAAQGTDDIDIDGGVDVTVTAEGVTSGEIGVGSNTSPTGAITVTQTGAAYTAATGVGLGDITISGGTTVNVTQVASSDTTAAEDDTSAATTAFGAVTVTGGETTTSVTVTQDARNTAVNYDAANEIVGEMGVANGNVDIYDANAMDATEAGTITTVTLNNFATATVDSSALTTVNLSGTGNALTIGRGDLTATPTANTLTINADGFTSTGAITDGEASSDDGFTTINLNATGDATTIDELVAADMTTLNISGDAAVELTTLTAAALTSVTAGDGGVTIGSALATTAAFTSGAGDDSIIVGATTEAIATGAGADVVTLVSGTTALGTDGTINAGDGVDTLVMAAADAVTASSNDTFEGSISNFEKLSLGAAITSSTVNLDNLDDINDVTLAGVGTSRILTLSGASTGVDVRFADATQAGATITLAEDGDADVANIHATTADNEATLQLVTLTGFETVNFNTADTDTDETDAVIEVTALTAADATAITVTGNAGLNIGTFAGTELTSFDASGVTAGAVTYTTGALDNAATLTGGAGADELDASAATASVTLSGNAGDDTLTGSAQADTIDGGAGDDVITGGAGDDVITAGAGADVITTGAGADTVIFTAVADSTGAARDTVTDFETGVDKLQFALSGATVDVSGFETVSNFTDGVIGLNSAAGDLFYSTADGKLFIDANADGQINSGNDYVVSIGAVAAGDLSFDITGTTGVDTLTGGLGDDTFTGGTGADIITSGGGDDVITDYDTDVLSFGEVVTIASAVTSTVGSREGQSYSSNSAGLVEFVADIEDNPDADWTLAEMQAAVQADETLSAADQVSLFSNGDDSYVYYTGATADASDDQFMMIEGGNTFKAITLSGTDGGFTLGGAPITMSTTSFAAYAGSDAEASWHGTNFTHTFFSINHGSLNGYDNIQVDLTTTTPDAIDTAINGNTYTLLKVDTANATAPQYAQTATARNVTGATTGDLIFGGSGNDTIDGGLGDDAILAGAGDDSITGGAGADVLSGGAGDDTFVFADTTEFTDGSDTDTIDGGDGNDTLVITAQVTTATDLGTVAAIADVENLTLTAGSTHAVTLDAEMTAATVTAGAAEITLSAAGQDVTGASGGILTVNTTAANVVGSAITGNNTADVLVVTDAVSTALDLSGLSGIENVTLDLGSTAVVTLDADTTTVTIGDNAASIATSAAAQTIDADAMADGEALTLTGSTTATVTLTAGDLAAGAYTGNLSVTATTGTNELVGGSGNDTIDGGDGNDIITGGAGADVLTGGLGEDTFVFAADLATNGADTIKDFLAADDVLDFQAFTAVGINALRETGSLAQQELLSNGKVLHVLDEASPGWNDVLAVLNAAIDTSGDVTGNTVLLVDNGTDTRVYFYEDDANAAAIEAAEISLVGTLEVFDGANASFGAANFLL